MINLKFIGRTYYRIKKFFAPAKWETIWTSKCSGRRTWNGEIGTFTAIVKYDRYKHKYQSYMTDGITKQDIELAVFVNESEKLGEILKNRNINY